MTRAMYSSSSDLGTIWESWFKDIEMKWNAGVLGHCVNATLIEGNVIRYVKSASILTRCYLGVRPLIYDERADLRNEMKWNAGVLGHCVNATLIEGNVIRM